MTHYGMAIDLKRCFGCQACAAACKIANNLPKNVVFNRVSTVGGEFPDTPAGEFPNCTMSFLPFQCQHCENPACLEVCPTGATYTDDTGTVLVDYERCIGCRYCMAACPYQVRVHNKVSGAVEKCKFCHAWVYEHPETPSNTCVTACVTGCRIFGDLDDPNSELSRAIVEKNALPIAGDLTKAKIFYVR